MDKKTKIIIIVSVILILIILLLVYRNNKKNSNKNQIEEQTSTTTTYNEEQSLYKVVDKETGEVLYEGSSEAEAYLYQIDPTFKASNPDDIDEYSFSEEFVEDF